MKEKTAMFWINILKNIINVYFDTFFVFYFFEVANYEVLPLAKYYLILYVFSGIGFFLVRNAMKKNLKVPYFRIGISLQAIYIALIMLLKDQMINHIFLIGFTKGIAEGFFYFPKNILETEKVTNDERQKYSGVVNTISKISSIVVPLILGVSLTYISYTNLGKIFFLLFIVLFIISFYVKDYYYIDDNKIEMKKFIKVLFVNKNLRNCFLIPFLSGFTYNSGVMITIITLSKIFIFKTNLNLGVVDSICGALFLLMCVLFTNFIKKRHFSNISIISGIISFFTLVIYAFIPNLYILIIYLFVSNSLIGLLNLISNNINANLSNAKEIKGEFKAEFYLLRDIVFSISRCVGYLLLLIVSYAFGINTINYILILSALAILIESFIDSKLSKYDI